jgi:short-subunit dehydrogenase
VENRLEDELRVIALNVTSSVHLAHRALESMAARGSGGVLVTSSIAAIAPGPFMAIYGASKAFLYQFVESVRPELAETGVTITALMPGATDTAFFERADMTDTKLGQANKDDPDLVARQGFNALMSGKDKVIAGSTKVKLQAAAAQALPDPLVARVQRSQGQPGGGN